LEAVETKVVALEAKFTALENTTSNYKKEDGTYEFVSKVEKPAEVNTNDEIQAHIQAKKDAKKEKKAKK
jgi:malate synthase